MEQIPPTTAISAVLASTLLRLPWLVLVLLMPRTATGAVLFYLVVASAGIVLLHWCLGKCEWTISFRAAFLARALPGLVAAALAATWGFHASLPAVAVLAVAELVVCIVAVSLAASRPAGWHTLGTGFEDGELLWLASDRLDDAPADPADRYSQTAASLVRAARATRFT
jgi:hypothetical protein